MLPTIVNVVSPAPITHFSWLFQAKDIIWPNIIAALLDAVRESLLWF
jgi:hypothetical protein